MGLCRMQSSRLALLIAAILSVAPLAAAQQDVKFVQTAEDFQEAVTLGIRHIVIERHLDLRTLPAAPAAEVPGARLVITSKTKSIRVRCSAILTLLLSSNLALLRFDTLGVWHPVWQCNSGQILLCIVFLSLSTHGLKHVESAGLGTSRVFLCC